MAELTNITIVRNGQEAERPSSFTDFNAEFENFTGSWADLLDDNDDDEFYNKQIPYDDDDHALYSVQASTTKPKSTGLNFDAYMRMDIENFTHICFGMTRKTAKFLIPQMEKEVTILKLKIATSKQAAWVIEKQPRYALKVARGEIMMNSWAVTPMYQQKMCSMCVAPRTTEYVSKTNITKDKKIVQRVRAEIRREETFRPCEYHTADQTRGLIISLSELVQKILMLKKMTNSPARIAHNKLTMKVQTDNMSLRDMVYYVRTYAILTQDDVTGLTKEFRKYCLVGGMVSNANTRGFLRLISVYGKKIMGPEFKKKTARLILTQCTVNPSLERYGNLMQKTTEMLADLFVGPVFNVDLTKRYGFSGAGTPFVLGPRVFEHAILTEEQNAAIEFTEKNFPTLLPRATSLPPTMNVAVKGNKRNNFGSGNRKEIEFTLRKIKTSYGDVQVTSNGKAACWAMVLSQAINPHLKPNAQIDYARVIESEFGGMKTMPIDTKDPNFRKWISMFPNLPFFFTVMLKGGQFIAVNATSTDLNSLPAVNQPVLFCSQPNIGQHHIELVIYDKNFNYEQMCGVLSRSSEKYADVLQRAEIANDADAHTEKLIERKKEEEAEKPVAVKICKLPVTSSSDLSSLASIVAAHVDDQEFDIFEDAKNREMSRKADLKVHQEAQAAIEESKKTAELERIAALEKQRQLNLKLEEMKHANEFYLEQQKEKNEAFLRAARLKNEQDLLDLKRKQQIRLEQDQAIAARLQDTEIKMAQSSVPTTINVETDSDEEESEAFKKGDFADEEDEVITMSILDKWTEGLEDGTALIYDDHLNISYKIPCPALLKLYEKEVITKTRFWQLLETNSKCDTFFRRNAPEVDEFIYGDDLRARSMVKPEPFIPKHYSVRVLKAKIIQAKAATSCKDYYQKGVQNISDANDSIKNFFSKIDGPKFTVPEPFRKIIDSTFGVTHADDVDLMIESREDEEDAINAQPDRDFQIQAKFSFDEFTTKPAQNYFNSFMPRRTRKIQSTVESITIDGLDFEQGRDVRDNIVSMGKLKVKDLTYGVYVLTQRGPRAVYRLSPFEVLKTIMCFDSHYDEVRDEHTPRWKPGHFEQLLPLDWFQMKFSDRFTWLVKNPKKFVLAFVKTLVNQDLTGFWTVRGMSTYCLELCDALFTKTISGGKTKELILQEITGRASQMYSSMNFPSSISHLIETTTPIALKNALSQGYETSLFSPEKQSSLIHSTIVYTYARIISSTETAPVLHTQ